MDLRIKNHSGKTQGPLSRSLEAHKQQGDFDLRSLSASSQDSAAVAYPTSDPNVLQSVHASPSKSNPPSSPAAGGVMLEI